MQVFKIDNKINIACYTGSTLNGFKHTAELLLNGSVVSTTKILYYNRTWERYQYESVMRKLINNTTALTDKEKQQALKKIDK